MTYLHTVLDRKVISTLLKLKSRECLHSSKLKFNISKVMLKTHSLRSKALLRTLASATSECSKCLGVSFHSSESKWGIGGNYFYASWQKGKACFNLVLQFIIFCIFKDILFSVNKSNFFFKGWSSILTDSINGINFSILQFSIGNSQIKQFIIFDKFSWNSFSPIWGVIKLN